MKNYVHGMQVNAFERLWDDFLRTLRKSEMKDVDSTLAVVRAQKEITGNRSRDKQIIRHFGIPNSFAFSPRMKFPGLETLSESEKQAFIKGYKRRLKDFTV